ncbi:hypothetical protein M427DRAFT_184027 [Gonapodya prolifera JEL478]|uniref:Uncharacterized protein n=1 Tax=Gonapodya prolifera (strain JEL478) TaxID=1344416 RepID=A0A139A0J9_GONPJ|nr:hypothetical protein M427DRAFT_184027 [Gonapodya prolifera JEL478]|eukprot:KXS10307.1 hypothetical protein M427DRAFT_184027 [Gonapodya prolifera JEL478]
MDSMSFRTPDDRVRRHENLETLTVGFTDKIKTDAIRALVTGIQGGAFPQLRRLVFCYAPEGVELSVDADDFEEIMDPCMPSIAALKNLLETSPSLSILILGDDSAEFFTLMHLRKDTAASSRRMKAVTHMNKPRIALQCALVASYHVMDGRPCVEPLPSS